jgi:hypothetical protein
VLIRRSQDGELFVAGVGYFTHAAMTNDEREVLFQSQKEDKAEFL